MSNQSTTQRVASALPSAREIDAVRFTHTEVRIDKHGREQVVTVTDPWPTHFTTADVLSRVLRQGLRSHPSPHELKLRRRYETSTSGRKAVQA